MLAATTTDATAVRLEFTRIHHRISKVRGYIGTLHLYDDRLAFVPLRESWKEYALTWPEVNAMCYEEGPIVGDLFARSACV